MLASLEAQFLPCLIHITQNRMARPEAGRADLDLPSSLLADHESTHLPALLRSEARHLGVRESVDPAVTALSRPVLAEDVPAAMERSRGDPGSDV